ncbi:MAG TPA: UbiD family decarboxylase [Lachnospiraceae bacterium]|nr:UbiD family decarboxylase [Lachnospiraceae bacterium]
MKHIKDLREFIIKLEKEDLVHIVDEEVDWNLEIGAILRIVNEKKGPAVLFTNIKDYPKEWRILGTPVGASSPEDKLYGRIAISLGLEPDANAVEIIEQLSTLRDHKLISPKVVATAKCKENILLGENINLLKIPIPYLHDGDGGRYIGTWHTVITKTVDGKFVNWGMYRVMLHDEKTLTGLVVPTQHIGMQFAQWKEKNQDMPFAIVIGTEPAIPLISSMNVPYGICEGDVVGGYFGEGVEVVQCETVDLQVPASAEIVIEGHVSINELCDEGPFGEYTGFMTFASKQQPAFHVSAITHRNNPILTVVCPGKPIDDHVCMSLSLAGDALNIFRYKNLPVLKTYIPPTAALHLLIITVDKQLYKGEDLIADIAKAIWTDKVGTLIPKIIVLDKDVDPMNMDDVIWSFSTKCHPERGTRIFPPTAVFPLSPYLSKQEKHERKSATIIYDCTFPNDWESDFIPQKVVLESLWPEEIQKKVEAKWEKYGFSFK